MTRTAINPRSTSAIPYQLVSAAPVAIHVIADAPVDVYVVDADGRAEYERSDNFRSLVGSTNRRDHALTAALPAGTSYLLIANPAGDRAVMVDYELRPIYTGGPTGTSGSYWNRWSWSLWRSLGAICATGHASS